MRSIQMQQQQQSLLKTQSANQIFVQNNDYQIKSSCTNSILRATRD